MPMRRDVHAGQTPGRDGGLRQAPRVATVGARRVSRGVDPGTVPHVYQAPARTARLPGEWASKSNTYGIAKRGGLYRKRGTAAWEAAVRAIAADGVPLEGPVAAVVLVRSATQRKDAHNILKALLDAGESRLRKGRTIVDTGRGWYRNDRQVHPVLVVPLTPGPAETLIALWEWRGNLAGWLTAVIHWIEEVGYAGHGGTDGVGVAPVRPGRGIGRAGGVVRAAVDRTTPRGG